MFSKPVSHFVKEYNHADFQARLNRLYSSSGHSVRSQDAELWEIWARNLYLEFRDNPFQDPHKTLNKDRGACLELLYELVNAWETSADKNRYEEEIANIFQDFRLTRILFVCVLMDRAQSLFKMRISTSTLYGMHWFSKMHLEEGTAYAVEYAEDQSSLRAIVTSGYKGFGTMNRRIFKMLHTDRFGLLNGQDTESICLAKWSRPAYATFVELANPKKRSNPSEAEEPSTTSAPTEARESSNTTDEGTTLTPVDQQDDVEDTMTGPSKRLKV